jgi:glycine cleavage system H lipoate-binding protein
VEKIDGIRWRPPAGMVEAGTLIAEVMAGERVIPVHSPVKGRFLGKNPKLGECCSVVIESPEDKGWLFLMAPSVFGRKDEGLLKPEDYRKLIRIKN